MLYSFFTSLKLTLTLLLGISFISIFGTLAKAEDNRFEVFYQAAWFRLILLLLALNIAACTWKTIQRNLKDRSRFLERLATEKNTTGDADLASFEQTLKLKKFRIEHHGDALLGSRGRIGRWGSTIVHISLLLIMLGGVLGELGFVGTQMIPAGKSTTTYYNWDLEMDRPLGFEFRVDHFELDYYPIELKVGVYEPENRKLIEEFVTREGEVFNLPLQGLTAKVINFEPFDKALTLDIYRGQKKIGNYRALPGDSKEQVTNFLDQFMVIKPMAFRDPILKQTLADVSILENGQLVKQQRIMVNHPLIYKGVAFYQTAYNQDEFGFWYVGFQISKDPGEWLVWTGSISLIIGFFFAFAIRYRVLGVLPGEGPGRIRPFTGFSDPYGQKMLDEIKQAVDHQG